MTEKQESMKQKHENAIGRDEEMKGNLFAPTSAPPTQTEFQKTNEVRTKPSTASERARNRQSIEDNKPHKTYEASEEHAFYHDSMKNTIDDSTPISRAWSRLYDRGINIGPALSEQIEREGEIVQVFTFAIAHLSLADDNVNDTVIFTDARGVVGQDSGL